MPIPHHVPIFRIPPELLAEILLLCVPLRCRRVSERSSILFPSQVCHLWRSTALSTPALWTFILFLCRREEDIGREEEYARVWLSRSGQCPLFIEVDVGKGRAHAKAALQILIPHCTRWKAIDTKSHWLDPQMWSQVAGKLPLLQSVNLYYEAPHDAFAIAPCLQRIQLDLKYLHHFLGP